MKQIGRTVTFDEFIKRGDYEGGQQTEGIASAEKLKNIIDVFVKSGINPEVLPAWDSVSGNMGFVIFENGNSDRDFLLEVPVFGSVDEEIEVDNIGELRSHYDHARANKWSIYNSDSPLKLQIGFSVINSESTKRYYARLSIIKDWQNSFAEPAI